VDRQARRLRLFTLSEELGSVWSGDFIHKYHSDAGIGFPWFRSGHLAFYAIENLFSENIALFGGTFHDRSDQQLCINAAEFVARNLLRQLRFEQVGERFLGSSARVPLWPGLKQNGAMPSGGLRLITLLSPLFSACLSCPQSPR
jgi:hypothetical protein